jgi:16S rRNA (adenine1518-N6/adenine1519-N6)-dimethyltransferase
MSVKPKKFLGQHFLKDENIAHQIAAILSGNGYDDVLEIGPGTGMLTKYLLQRKEFATTCIEVDRESIAFLKDHYADLKVMDADFLRIDLRTLFPKPVAVIGNFPYNISSQIVFKILENPSMVPEFGGMFQKEVAQRLCASHGNKSYGILSVLLQTFYDVKYLFTVSPHVFNPPPKVDSGVMVAIRKNDFQLPVDRKIYYNVVKTAFNQRRKTLRNALSTFNFDWVGNDYTEIAKLRAEQLSVSAFLALAEKIERHIKGL